LSIHLVKKKEDQLRKQISKMKTFVKSFFDEMALPNSQEFTQSHKVSPKNNVRAIRRSIELLQEQLLTEYTDKSPKRDSKSFEKIETEDMNLNKKNNETHSSPPLIVLPTVTVDDAADSSDFSDNVDCGLDTYLHRTLTQDSGDGLSVELTLNQPVPVHITQRETLNQKLSVDDDLTKNDKIYQDQENSQPSSQVVDITDKNGEVSQERTENELKKFLSNNDTDESIPDVVDNVVQSGIQQSPITDQIMNPEKPLVEEGDPIVYSQTTSMRGISSIPRMSRRLSVASVTTPPRSPRDSLNSDRTKWVTVFENRQGDIKRKVVETPVKSLVFDSKPNEGKQIITESQALEDLRGCKECKEWFETVGGIMTTEKCCPHSKKKKKNVLSTSRHKRRRNPPEGEKELRAKRNRKSITASPKGYWNFEV